MPRSLLSLALFFLLGQFSFQAVAEKIPMELQDVGIDEHLGSNVDLNLQFRDESGKLVPLKNYFNGTKPVLLSLVYYGCPNLCTMVLNSVVDTIKKMKWTAGQQFELVTVSIDPKETPALAATKKEAYLKLYGRPEGAGGWHFLVGQQPEISKLSQQVGFKFKWDDEQKQFAHTSAIFILTPDGKISRYFYGIDYPPTDVRVSMLEASNGKIGTIVDKFLMFCYHYDGATKKYVLLASRVMTAGGAVTVLALAFFFIFIWSREKNQFNAQHASKGG